MGEGGIWLKEPMTEKQILTYIRRTILNGKRDRIEKVLKRRWKLDTSYELAKTIFTEKT